MPESPVDPNFFLHGDGWLLPWQRVAGSASSVTLQLDSQCGPFHYLAEIDYRLQGVSLLARISLTHLGETPCLYGAGFHPFFWRDEQTKIRFLASGVWQEGRIICRPTGRADWRPTSTFASGSARKGGSTTVTVAGMARPSWCTPPASSG
ncbi:hypothetical protein FKF78_18395 [Aeromonas hydrophila]|nr:hypothetical protein [Aeromonas hydrophila]